MPRTREQLAERAAQELGDGFYVNLGIGIPTLVANYIPEGMTVSSAELTPDQKNAISHRAKAMAAMAPKIAESLS